MVILKYNIYVVFFISGFGAGNISILCVLTLGRFYLYYKAHLYYILYNWMFVFHITKSLQGTYEK